MRLKLPLDFTAACDVIGTDQVIRILRSYIKQRIKHGALSLRTSFECNIVVSKPYFLIRPKQVDNDIEPEDLVSTVHVYTSVKDVLESLYNDICPNCVLYKCCDKTNEVLCVYLGGYILNNVNNDLRGFLNEY